MIGQRLGPYRIDRELGSGGMGTVYAAVVEGRCPGLATGTHVALKVVHPHLLETPGFFKRFLREAEIGKAVVHENVVRTLDCDEIVDGGVVTPSSSMEYVEGQTLRGAPRGTRPRPRGALPPHRPRGREGARRDPRRGRVHRDLKPENVLITKDHVVKVMDLGVARLSDEALRLSQTGAFVGSVQYAAPEWFGDDAKRVDGRADLHALGLVLYELASGFNPYRADDRAAGPAAGAPRGAAAARRGQPAALAVLRGGRPPPAREGPGGPLRRRDDAPRRPRGGREVARGGRSGRRRSARRRSGRCGASASRARRRSTGASRNSRSCARSTSKAKAGEGQVVLVEGEAGIGK